MDGESTRALATPVIAPACPHANTHQDEDFHIIYINEKINREEWRTFEVGKTRFNDQAIRKTGEFLNIRDHIYNVRRVTLSLGRS
jgi:hypothetical protein